MARLAARRALRCLLGACAALAADLLWRLAPGAYVRLRTPSRRGLWGFRHGGGHPLERPAATGARALPLQVAERGAVSDRQAARVPVPDRRAPSERPPPIPDPRDAIRSGPPGLDIDAVTSLVKRQLGGAEGEEEGEGSSPPREAVLDDETALQEVVPPEHEESLFRVRLSRTSDGEDILLLLDKTRRFSAQQVAAICHRIAHKRRKLDEEFSDDARLLAFTSTAGLEMSRTAPDATSAASLLWSIALLRYQIPVLEDLLPGVCLAFPQAASEMNLGNLTASLTAVTRMHRDLPEVSELVQPLLQGIVDRVYELKPVAIASTIWAVGDMGLDKSQLGPLLDAILPDLSLRRLDLFRMKDLTNLLWGLTQLGVRDAELMARIAQAATNKVQRMRQTTTVAVNIPKLICGFARQRFEAPEFRQAVAVRFMQKGIMREINDWGVCALAWSWPGQDEEGLTEQVRQVARRITQQLERRKLTPRQVARGWEAPQDWYDAEE